MKNLIPLFLSAFIISCNNMNVVNSETPKITSKPDLLQNSETELAKLKIIKHDELKINKDYSNLHTKEELYQLKNNFKCTDLYSPPEGSGFGGFEPEKDILICSTFDHYENTVLGIYRTTYLSKESDNTYKEYKSLNELFLPVNTKEEALSFALNSTGYKTVNNTKDIKDLLTKHDLDSGSNYQFLNVNKFQIKDDLKVFATEVNETFVEANENGSYSVYLFYYQGNLDQSIGTCKPILWQVAVQVDKNGEIKELSKTKILEDGVIDNCRGPVA